MVRGIAGCALLNLLIRLIPLRETEKIAIKAIGFIELFYSLFSTAMLKRAHTIACFVENTTHIYFATRSRALINAKNIGVIKGGSSRFS